MRTLRALQSAKDTVQRMAFALGIDVGSRPPVNIVADNAEWAIAWMARYICRGVNAMHPGLAALTARPASLRNRVVHFGTRDIWLTAAPKMAPANQIVVTCLHGNPGDGDHFKRSLESFAESLPRVAATVTSTRGMAARLARLGVAAERLHVIPLGVDTATFVAPTAAQREAARRSLAIPEGRWCIGSFQKDGEGWGEGLEPKRIKGPDVFVETVARIGRDLPVVVLLTGPARGYVKSRLDALGIPFVHHAFDDYAKIVRAYHALDAYLITSREEGGPLALLESMATKVPVVATAVGMVPDVVRHGENGMVAASEDCAALAGHVVRVLVDADLRGQMVARAYGDVRAYDWMRLADRYYREVYTPLLAKLPH